MNKTFYSPGTFTISAEVADDTALTNALAWNVFVPATPPLLTPSLHGDTLTIAWPADATGYVLEMSESLGPAALWRAVAGDVTVVNGQRTMSVVLSGPTVFFRLWRP